VKLSYFIDCADDLGVAFVEAKAATGGGGVMDARRLATDEAQTSRCVGA
jgi:hypothetical protein